jgi:hypothetical protein
MDREEIAKIWNMILSKRKTIDDGICIRPELYKIVDLHLTLLAEAERKARRETAERIKNTGNLAFSWQKGYKDKVGACDKIIAENSEAKL